MKSIPRISGYLICTILTAVAGHAAPFANLDFEQGDTSRGVIQVHPDGSSEGIAEFWIPAWKVFQGPFGGANSISLNLTRTFNSAHTLFDSMYIYGLPLEGKLGFLGTWNNIPTGGASLVQTGEIPADAKSLRYKAHGGPWEVRVDGMSLDLVGWDDRAPQQEFQEVAIDVSAWAGRQVELKLSQAFGYEWNALDSIRFSPDPVIPEPKVGSLLLLGGGALWLLQRWSRS